MNTIKWGILGPGKIAHKFAEDLLHSKHGRLHAVASRTKAKASKFAAQFNAAFYYDSYEKLVNDPLIDVIYVSTPHTFHYEHALLCLQNNKSVLCEKPLAVNLAEVEHLIHEAEKRRLFLMEAMWSMFVPGFVRALDIIHSGILGSIERAEANFGFLSSSSNKIERLYENKLGGGSLLDIGIYPVFFALEAFGQPDSFTAEARIENQIDTSCRIVFNYNLGFQAILSSTIKENTSLEASVFGTKGSLKIEKPFHHPKRLCLELFDSGKKEIEIDYTGYGYCHEIEAVNSCLLQEKTQCEQMNHFKSRCLMHHLDLIRKRIGLTYPNDFRIVTS